MKRPYQGANVPGASSSGATSAGAMPAPAGPQSGAKSGKRTASGATIFSPPLPAGTPPPPPSAGHVSAAPSVYSAPPQQMPYHQQYAGAFQQQQPPVPAQYAGYGYGPQAAQYHQYTTPASMYPMTTMAYSSPAAHASTSYAAVPPVPPPPVPMYGPQQPHVPPPPPPIPVHGLPAPPFTATQHHQQQHMHLAPHQQHHFNNSHNSGTPPFKRPKFDANNNGGAGLPAAALPPIAGPSRGGGASSSSSRGRGRLSPSPIPPHGGSRGGGGGGGGGGGNRSGPGRGGGRVGTNGPGGPRMSRGGSSGGSSRGGGQAGARRGGAHHHQGNGGGGGGAGAGGGRPMSGLPTRGGSGGYRGGGHQGPSRDRDVNGFQASRAGPSGPPHRPNDSQKPPGPSTPGGQSRSSAARSSDNRIQPWRERKWGTSSLDSQPSNALRAAGTPGGGKDKSGFPNSPFSPATSSMGGREGFKRTLTDFRIAMLSIDELDWEWKADPARAATVDPPDVVVSPAPPVSAPMEPRASAGSSSATSASVQVAEGSPSTSSSETASATLAPSPQPPTSTSPPQAASMALSPQPQNPRRDVKHRRDDDDDDVAPDAVAKKARVKSEEPEEAGMSVPAFTATVPGESATVVLERVSEERQPSAEDVKPDVDEPAPSSDAPKPSLPPTPLRENSRLRIYFSAPAASLSASHSLISASSPRPAHSQAIAGEPESSAASTTSRVTDDTAATTAFGSDGTAGLPEVKEEDIDGEPVAALEDGVDGEEVVEDESADDDLDGSVVEIDGQEQVDDAGADDNAEKPSPDVGEANAEGTQGPESAVDQPEAASQELVDGDVSEEAQAEQPRGSQADTQEAPATVDPVAPKAAQEMANRVSISYARNTRRIIIDADSVESLRIFRAEGRIEVTVRAVHADESSQIFKGVIVESLDPDTEEFGVVEGEHLQDGAASHLPPLTRFVPEKASFTIKAFLDRVNPLTEARWVKTGDVEGWINQLDGSSSRTPGAAAEERREHAVALWRGKISVADPEPPPTIHDALETWISSSSAGSLQDRRDFVAAHMSNIDNVFEILLRLTRGDGRGPAPAHVASTSQPAVVGALAASLNAPYAEHQTQVSLAVLAMLRLSMETAVKAGIAKEEMEKQVGEIVRGIPHHLFHKSVDSMFREYRASH